MAKILGIDYGQKRIGLALSDDDKKFAFVYNTLNAQNTQEPTVNKIVADIKNICKLEDIECVVVGIPTGLSGNPTRTTQKTFDFVEKLEKSLGVPVEIQDERLTTVQAHRIKDKSSRNIDELSAQIILQTYLDKINL